MLAKSDFPAELDIPLPFSLLNNNVAKDQLEIIPAFWWLYNMYALARNTWKFTNRDKRIEKTQHIEFNSLAPDTAEEIINARFLLEVWTAKALQAKMGVPAQGNPDHELANMGRQALTGNKDAIKGLEVLGENLEKSRRKVVIAKVYEAYHAYGDMLHYYAMSNLMDYLAANPGANFSAMREKLQGRREKSWTNLGGQLMPAREVDSIREDIGSGLLATWDQIHQRYNALWEKYALEKQKHAFATLCWLIGTEKPSLGQWQQALDNAIRIKGYVRDQVFVTRKKDMDNPFMQSTYRNKEEMEAAIGTIENNHFITQTRNETEEYINTILTIKSRG